ncbi:hypothetical protein Nepgr_021740 [Nepenthes gracilis]|uniref:Uncharacterized protein n=1 Tax=Nepenthes gracilis TaxID=150966 RepID=A0AAD3SZ79_NEPGR|nr:hypothetical protein Nepgr_021740 [Nepenthes gracilis]
MKKTPVVTIEIRQSPREGPSLPFSNPFAVLQENAEVCSSLGDAKSSQTAESWVGDQALVQLNATTDDSDTMLPTDQISLLSKHSSVVQPLVFAMKKNSLAGKTEITHFPHLENLASTVERMVSFGADQQPPSTAKNYASPVEQLVGDGKQISGPQNYTTDDATGQQITMANKFTSKVDYEAAAGQQTAARMESWGPPCSSAEGVLPIVAKPILNRLATIDERSPLNNDGSSRSNTSEDRQLSVPNRIVGFGITTMDFLMSLPSKSAQLETQSVTMSRDGVWLVMMKNRDGKIRVMNGPIISIARELGFEGNSILKGLVVSIFIVGAFIGSLFLG